MISFENAFVNPNIQITPNELPLEQMQKTSDTIQGRYDKAYEEETKTRALGKKLQASADPADRELAKQIMNTYGTRLDDRAKTGDYQNMRWQTAQDAQEFGDIYQGLSEKAKTMQKYRDHINTANGLDTPGIRQYYLDKFNKDAAKSQFDPNSRILSGLNVEAPSLVEDTDWAKLANDFGAGWKADSVGGKSVRTVFTKPGEKLGDGSTSAGGAYKETSVGKWEQVKEKDIKKGLYDFFSSDPSAKATIDRDTQFSISKQPLREGETIESRRKEIEHNDVSRAVEAAANKYGYTNSYTEKDDIADDRMNAAMGAGNPQDPDFNLNVFQNQITSDKAIEPIQAEKTKMLTTGFNTDGTYKKPAPGQDHWSLQVPPNVLQEEIHKVKAASPSSADHGIPITDAVWAQVRKNLEGKYPAIANSPQTFDEMVPPWQQERINPNGSLSQKQVYERFKDDEMNRTKNIMAEYYITSKGSDANMNANIKRQIGNMKIVYPGTETPISDVDRKTLIDNGEIVIVPGTGQLTLSGIDKEGKVIKGGTVLGNQNYPGATNAYQNDMLGLQKMIKDANNPHIAFSAGNEYKIGEKRFRMIKSNQQVKGPDNKMHYVMVDQIQEVNGNASQGGSESTDQRWDINDPTSMNNFVKHAISPIVGGFDVK